MYSSTRDAQEEHIHALRELRRGIGCTTDRIFEYALLVQALRTKLAPRGRQPSHESLIAEMTNQVQSISDPKHRDAILVALNLDPRYQQRTLVDRRRQYNQDLWESSDPEVRNLRVGNLRTLERRENQAIEWIARNLIDHREPSSAPHNDFSTDRKPAQSDLEIEAISNILFFSESGVLQKQETHRWVRASSEYSTRELTVAHWYVNGSRPGTIRIDSLYGCSVASRTETASGELIADLRIFRGLQPHHGPYAFGTVLNIDSDAQCRPVINWRPQSHATKRIEFHLNFHSSFKPVRAWWFQSRRDILGHVEPNANDNRHLEQLDEGSYLYQIFEHDHIIPNQVHGLSWVWP